MDADGVLESVAVEELLAVRLTLAVLERVEVDDAVSDAVADSVGVAVRLGDGGYVVMVSVCTALPFSAELPTTSP